jgi:L-rhamnose-H+ transport protein
MVFLLAIIYAIFAGFINGSFALPTKRTKQWQFEHVWLNFALWGFLIIPWASILFFAPDVKLVYLQMSLPTFLILIIGGTLFGIGQICFAQALKKIGLGLGFVLNIGLGTSLGFLLPLVVLHPKDIITPFGLTTILGGALIIIGLILSYLAGKKRTAAKQAEASLIDPASQPKATHSHAYYRLGVILACIAGIFSALQNFTFAATRNLQLIALQDGLGQFAASMIIWPIFLTFTFIPYVIYMIYLHFKHKSIHLYYHRRSYLNIQFAFLMGLFWFGSLILYSKAALLIGNLGSIVAWPIFMVCIILTSNFWSWREHEWEHAPAQSVTEMYVSLFSMIIAVIILGYSVTLT